MEKINMKHFVLRLVLAFALIVIFICMFNVNDVPKQILFSSSSLTVESGRYKYLRYTTVPDSGNFKIDVRSSDYDVVGSCEIDYEYNSIRILAEKPGQAMIRLECKGKVMAECLITVEPIHSIDNLKGKIKGHYNGTIYVSKKTFNDYLTKYEVPIKTEDDADAYYNIEDNQYENRSRTIQANGDIVTSHWDYYGDFAKEYGEIEYLDSYYQIKYKYYKSWKFKDKGVCLGEFFEENLSEIRYIDSMFMIIEKNKVYIQSDSDIEDPIEVELCFTD